MGGFILLCVLTILCWVVVALTDEYDGIWAVALPFGVLFSVFFIAVCINFGTENDSARSFQERRDYYQELVNGISPDTSFETAGTIIQRAKDMNARIETDRRLCNSKMWGFLYNDKIAEVEPINIPKLKYNDFKIEEDEGN